jgi:hypothetical protein
MSDEPVHPVDGPLPSGSPEPRQPESPAALAPSSMSLILAGSWLLLVAVTLLALLALIWILPKPDPIPANPLAIQRGIRVVGAALVVGVSIHLILGIGLFLARRWARALAEALGWFALVGGGIATLAVAAAPSPEAAAGGRIWAVGALGILGGVLPALFLGLVRSRRVRQAVEALHPRPSWTTMPMSRLALGLWLLLAGILGVATQLGGMPTPALLGQRFLGLWEARWVWDLYAHLMHVASLALGWGLLRQRRWAWRGTFIATGVAMVVALSTRPDPDLDTADRLARLGYSQAAIGQMLATGTAPPTADGSGKAIALLASLGQLGLLLACRRDLLPVRPHKEMGSDPAAGPRSDARE